MAGELTVSFPCPQYFNLLLLAVEDTVCVTREICSQPTISTLDCNRLLARANMLETLVEGIRRLEGEPNR